MKALCWHGKQKVSIDNVDDPKLVSPRDAIIKITKTAICGSDLHIYNGVVPTMESGDVLGHEFMGEVVEVGPENQKLKKGDRVVVPFTISCGGCFFCKKQYYSACDNSNPNAKIAEKAYGSSGAGLFGFSHMFGGFSGGQAEYVRVPFSDVGPYVIPNGIEDEKVLFLTDILPTGYMAAENCGLVGGETVAVWGCGPVGQLAIQSAFLLGAERVIAIDHVKSRLRMAAEHNKAETINFDEENVEEKLRSMTGGRGPDACIDAVGLEAHGMSADAIIDTVKVKIGIGTDRTHALRQAIMACRKCGVVSVPGLYAGLLDNHPFGAAFAKGLTIKMGQTHVQKYIPKLLELIQAGKLDTRYIITHRISLQDGPNAYQVFNENKEDCIKVVMTP